MKYVYLDGGLGNQLFQYAFSEYIGAKCVGVKYKFGRFLSIKRELVGGLCDEYSSVNCFYGALGKRAASLIPSVYVEKGLQDFNQNKSDFDDFKHFFGYFQCKEYVLANQRRIKSKLSGVDLVSCRGRQKTNDRRVAVHVRKGDFLLSPEHNVVSSSFYADAKSMFPDCQFDIFTDSPEILCSDSDFCNDNIIEGSMLAHFRGLQEYDNIIVGNSTFAWWAAFLSGARSVICPSELIRGVSYERLALSHWVVK